MEKSKELNAATVAQTLSAQSQCASASYSVQVCIFERFGNAFIQWLWPDIIYAIGTADVVQLREGSTFVKNLAVKSHFGQVDTGHAWGSGLNASYWAKDFEASVVWRQLVLTANT